MEVGVGSTVAVNGHAAAGPSAADSHRFGRFSCDRDADLRHRHDHHAAGNQRSACLAECGLAQSSELCGALARSERFNTGASPDYRLHISGGASYGNEVYVDGVPVMNPNLTGDISLDHPPIDSIGQFKLINNNQTAQYGLSSGIVSFAFKSGTNDFHGSLFDYLQNDALNAAGYMLGVIRARPQCQVTPLPATCKKAPLKQNEYGGTFGGPVWIPKLYNGRDKTFFFVDYTGFAYRPSANNATLTTIPNAFRSGDFSQLLGPQLTDPASGQPIFDPAGTSRLCWPGLQSCFRPHRSRPGWQELIRYAIPSREILSRRVRPA